MCASRLQEVWFEVLFVRSNLAGTVKGGVSSILRALLNTFFNPNTHDLRRSGVCLPLTTGNSLHLWISLDIVVADEAALHYMYGCKGAGGLKCCLLCQNIFNYKNERGIAEGDQGGWVQTHACTDSSKMVLHTPESITAVLNRLQSATVGISELQTRLGWSIVPNGVMFDTRTRMLCEPTAHALYDFMHVLFVSGVFNINFGYMMKALTPHGITSATLHEYLGIWTRVLRH
jgi:hypothetical protein